MPRERLPDRRAGVNFSFEHIRGDGSAFIYEASLGFYPDGRLGEVFCGCGRSGTDVDISTRDAAISLSLALQYGGEFEVLAAAFLRRDDNTPDGPLGTLCKLIVEDPTLSWIPPEQVEESVEREIPPIVEDLGLIMAEAGVGAEEAAAQYARDFPQDPAAQLVRDNRDPEQVAAYNAAQQVPDSLPPLVDRSREAHLRGYASESCRYASESCRDCGNYTLIRSGTCLTCDSCGATTGCS